jgi:hypothetical protein
LSNTALTSEPHLVRNKEFHPPTNSTKSQPASSAEAEIGSLIEPWAQAIREENRVAVGTDHDPEISMFDAAAPSLINRRN